VNTLVATEYSDDNSSRRRLLYLRAETNTPVTSGKILVLFSF